MSCCATYLFSSTRQILNVPISFIDHFALNLVLHLQIFLLHSCLWQLQHIQKLKEIYHIRLDEINEHLQILRMYDLSNVYKEFQVKPTKRDIYIKVKQPSNIKGQHGSFKINTKSVSNVCFGRRTYFKHWKGNQFIKLMRVVLVKALLLHHECLKDVTRNDVRTFHVAPYKQPYA